MLKIQRFLRQHTLPAKDRHRAAAHLSLTLLALVLAIALRNLDQHLTLEQERNRFIRPYQADFGSAALTTPTPGAVAYTSRNPQTEEHYHF